MISKNAARGFSGTWHIYEMETWDEDYFNMEVQAYIKINPSGSGEFQFGLVFGQLYGEIDKYGDDEKFEFTWDGNDECDPASGSGWLRLRDENIIEGKINIHHADSSKLLAKRAK